MKVLYVGVYRDESGWSKSIQDYILSLDAAGVDVVPRPVRYNTAKAVLPERILQLEQKSASGCDVLIQHNLPNRVSYNGLFKKNIIAYCTETTNFNTCGWARNINTMNEAWVVSQQMKDAAIISGVKIPIKVFPYATNIEKFQRSYEPIPQIKDAASGNFIFYTIAALHKRKNITAILKAFHTEFDPDEPVSLVIKTQAAPQNVVDTCSRVKAGLKRFNRLDFYKQEILHTHTVSDEEILRLHNTCDCFVLPSYGEAWGLPAFDAMGFGRTPIVTNWGGFTEFMSNDSGWMVNYRLEPVFGMQDFSFDNVYSSREEWASVDILHLMKCMREAYTNKELREQKSQSGMMRVYDFSYDIVGEQLKASLYEQTQ